MYRRTCLASVGAYLSISLVGSLRDGGGPETDGTENGIGNGNEDEKTLDPPRDLVLENEYDESRAVSVALSRGDETVYSVEYELEPGAERRVEGILAEPGEYRLEAALEDGTNEAIERNVYDEIWHAYVTITAEGELFLSYDIE